MNDTTIRVISNPDERKEFKALLVEITNCLLRIDAEREAMKEIVDAGKEKFEVQPKLIRKLASTMYKHNYADVQAENEHFEYLYEALVNGKKEND